MSTEELKDNQFEFEGNIVTVHDFKSEYHPQHRWSLRTAIGVTADKTTIAEINPDLFTKVEVAINKFHKKYQKLEEARKKDEEEKRIQEQTEVLAAFKEKLNKEVPELNQFDLKFNDPTKSFGNMQKVRIYDKNLKQSVAELNLGKANNYPNDTIYFVEFDFSDKRQYRHLKNAVKKIIEYRDAKVVEKIRKENKLNAYESFAKATGLKYTTGYESSGYGRHRKGYTTYHLETTKNSDSYYPDVKFQMTQTNGKVTVSHAVVEGPIVMFGKTVEKIEMDVELETAEEVKIFVDSVRRGMKEVGGN